MKMREENNLMLADPAVLPLLSLTTLKSNQLHLFSTVFTILNVHEYISFM